VSGPFVPDLRSSVAPASQAAQPHAARLLDLQRRAGNRATGQALRRAPSGPSSGGSVRVKTGVETTEVSPEVARLLSAKGIPYAQEVTFELLDANGVAVLKGRMDYFFRDPRTGAAIVTEVKGIDLEALTVNQKVYVPLFEGEGATIRITSRRGGRAKLQVRELLKIRGENFIRIARGNLKAFADALEQITTGGQVKYSWRDAEGLRFFKTEAEFDAFLATKGLTRIKPPPLVKPPEPPVSKPGKAPIEVKPPVEVKPPAPVSTAAEEALAVQKALEADRAALRQVAESQNLRITKEGGFATIGAMKSVVLLMGGAYLFIADVRANGFLKATEGLVANWALFKAFEIAGGRLGMRAPMGFWTGLGLSILLGMSDDQGPRYHEQQARNGMVFNIIYANFPGVLEWVGNEYCLQPFDWPCIEINSPWEIRDQKRFDALFPELLKLVENPWQLEPAK
jgi:hypothetical protein